MTSFLFPRTHTLPVLRVAFFTMYDGESKFLGSV
jgi:hypothetical protein